MALGTCVLTLMGIAAQDLGRDLPHAKASVEKKMKATPMRHIGKLTLVIEIGGAWNAEERAKLEEAALGCPVRASLGERTEVDMRFVWEA
ncbi:MAG: hypothetical protein R3E96_08150 [Planctomycetota bacterium]